MADQMGVTPPPPEPPMPQAPPPQPPPMAAPPAMPPGAAFANNSGQGPGTPVPPELQGWCWSGFLLTWIWCIPHAAWTGLVVTLVAGFLGQIMTRVAHIPIPLGLIGPIYCGLKGNEWAWQGRRWESIQQFRETQRVWVIWGIVIVAVGIVIGIIAGIVIAAAAVGMAHAMH